MHSIHIDTLSEHYVLVEYFQGGFEQIGVVGKMKVIAIGVVWYSLSVIASNLTESAILE